MTVQTLLYLYVPLLVVSLLGGLALASVGLVRRTFLGREAFGPSRSARALIMAAGACAVMIPLVVFISSPLPRAQVAVIPWFLLAALVAVFPLSRKTVRGTVIACGVSTLLLALFSIAAGFSIGPLYPPSAALLTAAGLTAWFHHTTVPAAPPITLTLRV